MIERWESVERRRQAARAAGFMMLAGALLAGISVALPPPARGSDLAILALGALCAVIATFLLWMRTPPPEWVLGLAAATGTAIITVATYEGGRVGTGTVDNVMLYIWICLLAFNFLNLRHALVQIALVGVCYALLLGGVPFGEAATRWTISLSSLLVAGLLVYRLRSSRAQLVEELSERARHDGLTGLLNRGALEERVRLELGRARRSGSPLSLIVLDIDQFKVLNDTKGHPAGDQILRTIAACLRQETRVIDAVARLGGDEFGALLPGAEEEDAVRVAERLVGHTLATGSDGQVTMSAGVAQVGSRENSFETLWQAADAAMYKAKRGGGDSVRTASQLEPADCRTAEASASSTRL